MNEENEKIIIPNQFLFQKSKFKIKKTKNILEDEELEELEKEEKLEIFENKENPKKRKEKGSENYVKHNFKTIKKRKFKKIISKKQYYNEKSKINFSNKNENFEVNNDNFDDDEEINNVVNDETIQEEEEEEEEKEEKEEKDYEKNIKQKYLKEYKTINNLTKKESLQSILKEYFKIDSFHEGQYEVIKNIIEKKSTLFISSTGSGKSLTYQLPSLLLKGLTIVITPLTSLMNDQIKQLPRCLKGEVLSSQENNKSQVYDKIMNNKIDILFVSPERFFNDDFIDNVKNKFPLISMICIDEGLLFLTTSSLHV
jgi:hypothetical protein